MIPPEAIQRFVHEQKRLLRRTYDAAWLFGMASYSPDADPEMTPRTPQHVAESGLSGAALMAVRRTYPYVAPTTPDPVRRAVSLAPSYAGLNRMTGELVTLVPTQAQVAAAAARGLSETTGAFAQALQDWVTSNGARLDGGDSVAWAGEAAGYGEAADADGQLLQWNASDDSSTCSDCETLGSMPPMPLSEWPCTPGDGATECNVGCRCDLEATDMSVLPGDTYAPTLTSDQQDVMRIVLDRQAAAMSAQMPDVQYLE